jgi:hypothetical protein
LPPETLSIFPNSPTLIKRIAIGSAYMCDMLYTECRATQRARIILSKRAALCFHSIYDRAYLLFESKMLHIVMCERYRTQNASSFTHVKSMWTKTQESELRLSDSDSELSHECAGQTISLTFFENVKNLFWGLFFFF